MTAPQALAQAFTPSALPNSPEPVWEMELEGSGTFSGAWQVTMDTLTFATDEVLYVVDMTTGESILTTELPPVESEFLSSESGWCPDAYGSGSLVVTEREIVLASCENLIGVFEHP